MTRQTANALPPIVGQQTWRAALDDLRKREKAATRELDAIAAQRRRLPMVELPDAAAAVATLREYGVRCLGAVAIGGAAPQTLALDGAVAFVVGNEARGLNAPLLGALDGTVTIPMAGSAESLNVAMATTVLCFEAARQRG